MGTVGAPGDYGQIVLSPDERNVAVETKDAERGYDLWVMDVARGVPSRVTAGPGDERNPVWSSDGRSLVFSSLQDGKTDLRRKGLRATEPETVLTDSPGGDYPESAGERVRVSVDGGGEPKRRSDGKELFEMGGSEGPDYDDFAPSADGQRFLVKVALDEAQPARTHVVTNWPSLVQ